MKQAFIQPLGEWRASNATNLNQLGDRVEYNGKWYEYVQYKAEAVTGITVANGTGVCMDGTNRTQVTADVSVGGTIPRGVIVLGTNQTIADLQYGWIQTDGFCAGAHALVSGAAGNPVVMSVTTDGSFKVAAAVTEAVAGILIDSANKIIQLRCGGVAR